jgi:hypothetical protein
MAGITKVGPPESDDYQEKPGLLVRALRWCTHRVNLNLLTTSVLWRRRPGDGRDYKVTRCWERKAIATPVTACPKPT